MAPTLQSTPPPPDPGTRRVRSRLLTALHLGKLHPGDRVPSVRRLADLTGMNRKAVHRAYRRLADEGWLDMRPGSGTFVADLAPAPIGQVTDADLVAALERCREESASLGITSRLFARFLHECVAPGLRETTLVVTECNRDQLDVMALDLEQALGVTTRPVLLRELAANAGKATEGAGAVVTTACHRTEVLETMAPQGKPTYHVALDSEFPQRLARHAALGPVLMVVRDLGFAGPFLRLLKNLSIPTPIIDRFRIVDARGARSALRQIADGGTLFVSPHVEAAVPRELPPAVRRVNLRWHVNGPDLERLRVRLAFDVALAGRREPASARG